MIGEEGVVHFDAKFVLPVEYFHGFNGLWDDFASSYEYTIDIKCVCEAIGG